MFVLTYIRIYQLNSAGERKGNSSVALPRTAVTSKIVADGGVGHTSIAMTEAQAVEQALSDVVQNFAQRYVHLSQSVQDRWCESTRWLQRCSGRVMFGDVLRWQSAHTHLIECGTPTERARLVMDSYLQLLDAHYPDLRYHRAAAVCMLGEGVSLKPWLRNQFADKNMHMALLTACVDANRFKDACRVLVDFLDKLADENTITNTATMGVLFPWQLMSRAMAGFRQHATLSAEDQHTLCELRRRLNASASNLQASVSNTLPLSDNHAHAQGVQQAQEICDIIRTIF
ncbi:hypothetical protein SARC_11281 [Sphaeroforma arctica JP610]|uniref:Uncharacterized protein n=1 Tax=Sphaeroforma arctica JP610 TaxID=667725 RepID=A0A0L0FHF4_9EUKA|nr:hypothetical protein SARC_11281 [Sphaeroforma arctica JP610]KNC76207.1 hypothetical protein SARC_11281 [Sphaeroforma arctica JP610]|eukprot:XP_014150109.1 hypothetical protein SARC_11281 [Sphaeroforma arctica JP610]